MYHVNLTIGLIGVPREVALGWQLVPTEPRYTHDFYIIDRPDAIQPAGQPLIILSQAYLKDYPLAVIRQRIGTRGKIILWVQDYETLTEDDIRQSDDCWPATRNLVVFRSCFAKFLRQLREQKDAWLEHNWLQTAINMLPDMIWFKDRQGRHIEVNDAFCEAVNKQKTDVRGKDHYYIWGIPREVYRDSGYVCVETEEDVIKARKACVFDEEVMAANGLRKLKTYKAPVFDENDNIIGTIGIARNVTQETENDRTIHDLAYRDYLTSLYNRAYLQKKVDEYHAGPVIMVVFDLDYFKELNDTYGHQSGDAALMVVGEFMQQKFSEAFNVRYGGDEFLTVFFGTNDVQQVMSRVKDFLNRLEGYFAMDKEFGRLTVSAGMHSQNITGGSIDLLFAACDKALYAAKLHGRNRIVQYEEIGQLIKHESQVQFGNRNETEMMLQEELILLNQAQLSQNKESGFGSAILIALDGMSAIEKDYGKTTGIQVVDGFADIINVCIRGSDKLGRWDQDTFMAVLPGATTDVAIRVVERIRRRLKEWEILPDAQRITVSCSLAAFTTDESYRTICDRLQTTLKEIQQDGHNQTCLAK